VPDEAAQLARGRTDHSRAIPEAVEALFQQAADLDPAQRGAFLDERCAGDPESRRRRPSWGDTGPCGCLRPLPAASWKRKYKSSHDA
jgi:hypothetical protein